MELLRIFQEVDDLFKLLLGFINPGHVFKRHAPLLFRQHTGLRFAEAHGLAAAALHLTHEKDPDADQQQHWEPGDQHAEERRYAIVGRYGADAHSVIAKIGHQAGVLRGEGFETPPVPIVTGDVFTLNGYVENLSVFHGGDKVRIGQRRLRRP